MAKTTGLGDRFLVAGYDISGDTNSVDQISGGPAALDVTDITQSANSRLGGLRTGEMDATVWMDNASGQEHPALSTLPRSDVITTYLRGTTLGNPAASCNGRQVNYDPTRGTDGSLSFKVQVQSDGFGIEWGEQLTPGVRTDTTPTSGTAVNDGTSTTFGAQGYCQVTAATGAAPGIRIEHSPSGTASWTTLIDFGTVAGHNAYRGTAAGSVNQYVRAVSYGTITSVTYAVQFTRNAVAVTF